jgi:hypothetical protein
VRRLLRVAIGALAVGVLGFAATGCNGNIDAADNCSLVLAGAVEYEEIPDVGWTLWDAYKDSTSVPNAAVYNCRGLTLAYGGVFVVYTVLDRDPILGGDGGYSVLSGPSYETDRYNLGGTAVWCSGHRVYPHAVGEKCSDLE